MEAFRMNEKAESLLENRKMAESLLMDKDVNKKVEEYINFLKKNNKLGKYLRIKRKNSVGIKDEFTMLSASNLVRFGFTK